ncbi:type I DNA topoisomerase [Salmonella enterica subsp. enterica serovar Virchow]|uniref:type I DNA topoisomerase n=1 Tax=Enterobacterales TaxID=91347 RepID=UPI000964A484|nr:MULTISPECIES: type I DNA topoisomerase [Enterobacterales]EDB3234680.1 type I DNA topoisomerase [Salmonella enterica subsp. enterica serovar Virchow]EKC8290661.1 type I DNA topoisomerase [Escherichia coli]MCL8564350.1 type I DNA topoisomerase [Proteus mirabilis]OLX12131.1 DNA topoisomerase I [Salmonella enterica subsp. enterica serovar Heidelberg]
MTTLVIVESPGKVKKISALLGAGYKVVASVGHVRDLPRKEIGIAPPNFQLAYEPTERGRDVLARLKKEVAQAESVILATDPDREGEAIAWHLADALNLKNPRRVTFSAITKAAIEAAIAAPRDIDMALVRAQEARRALDRIVGYRVSPELSNMAGQALSAGRVQSPAVRLVVDRERAIAAFKVTEHYGAELVFANEDGTKWKAAWDTKPHLQAGDEYLMDDELAKRVAEIRAVTVASFEDSEKGRAPAAPFTTSTLQQVAGKKLKLKPKRTMELAQRLYEQGAITYHRTDAPNMDAAGQEDIANYAKSVGLALAEKPRKWKAKDGAQEGHEAIRPTHAADLEAGETDEEKALYKLIWQRAVASQLADAIYAVRTVTLDGDAQGLAVKFNASGRTVTSPGWMAVYSDDTEEDEEAAASNPIPALSDGDELTAESGRMLTKKTKPPARFTESTLVAEMERMGIGRPSTYAAILENISGRSYVTTDAKGYLIPSEIGASVRDALVGRFKFAELDYTRGLEEQLDMIAEAKADYLPVVSAAWAALDDELGQLSTANIPVAHPCPACGKALSRRKGQYGFFWSCTGWPECDTKLPDNKGKPGERKAPPPPSGIPCPKCGKDLARRQGVSKPKAKGQKGRPYDFYSCTGYPKCDATYQTGEDGKPNLT